MRYVGSEEFIRLQFEEYLLSLISSVKCHNYLVKHANDSRVMLPQVEGDPTSDFGADWVEAWKRTDNYRIWDSNTDSHLFDIVEPKHPCAGGLTIDDVQRRLAHQVQEFHLDERFAVGKEALGRNIAAGKEKASTVFNKLYSDMEALRESQRRRAEEHKAAMEKNGGTPPSTPGFAPDMIKAQATVQSVGSKAGAYVSSWATWAGEKRRSGWGRAASTTPSPPSTSHAWSRTGVVPKELDNEKRSVELPSAASATTATDETLSRPRTQESYAESIFDAGSAHGSEKDSTEEPADRIKASGSSEAGSERALEPKLSLERVASHDV